MSDEHDSNQLAGAEASGPPSDEEREAIRKEAKRIEEDALVSSKGHFNAAKRWDKVHLMVGLPAAILAASGGVTALADHPTLGGVLAVLSAALMATLTFVKPNARSQSHRGAGVSYLSLKNRARSFAEIHLLVPRTPSSALLRDLKYLENERDQLSQTSPQIPEGAFRRARKGIQEGEAEYRVDKAARGTGP